MDARQARVSARKKISGGGPRRPTSARARLFVPLALIFCFMIVIVTVSSAGDSDKTDSSADQSQTEAGSPSRNSNSGAGSEGKSNSSAGALGGATSKTGKASYKVKAGDSFGAIAEKTGIDVDMLTELNPEIDPRALQPGQKIKLK